MSRPTIVVLFLWVAVNGNAFAGEGFYSGKLVSREVNGYVRQMACDDARGFHNTTHAVGELYNTQKEYEAQKKGRPFIRQCAALTDGFFRMIERAGSGLWDFLAGLVPGEQEGIPPKPETFIWAK